MTSNEYYGMLNDRFDSRMAVLIKMGFRVVRIEEHDMSVCTRRNPNMPNRNQSVANAFVMNADDRAWNDKLQSLIG